MSFLFLFTICTATVEFAVRECRCERSPHPETPFWAWHLGLLIVLLVAWPR